MRYFFVLGNHPSLSIGEIHAVLPAGSFTVVESSRQALIVETREKLDVAALMHRLGGTVKIGTMIDDIPATQAEFTDIMVEWLQIQRADSGAPYKPAKGDTPAVPAKQPSATFGFSVYSLDATDPLAKADSAAHKLRRAGMEAKRILKEAEWSARWVAVQQSTALTSVAVDKNKMLTEGAEFCVFAKKGELLVGITEAVQPYEDFSEADYGRPGRDAVQGMLPPKLARIMVNLTGVPAHADSTLLDPFCGSGTVLTEALQMGWGHALGSDKNPAAIESTLKNVRWAKEKGLVPEGADARAQMSDARDLAQTWGAEKMDAIVAETFLGPPRNGRESRGQLQQTLNALTNLFYQSLTAMKKVAKPGAVVVLALPVYVVGEERHGISMADFSPIGITVEPACPQPIMARIGDKPSKNGGLVYGRKGQWVWRDIVKFRFK